MTGGLTEAEVGEEGLRAWGRRVGAGARPPLFVALRGPLGAGKSVLARAVAEGAGVAGHIPSPTFSLVNRYPLQGRGSVVHADLYRLRSPAELDEIGWWEWTRDDAAIVLVEWPERAGPGLPADRWEVTLDFGRDPRLRTLTVTRRGAAPEAPGFAPARAGPRGGARRGEPR